MRKIASTIVRPSRISSKRGAATRGPGSPPIAVCVNEVLAEHRRKTGFMSGFDEVVDGLDPNQKRSFLERAKMCWAMPPAKDKQ
jgi:hypothetical protein